jgi:DNA-binding NarL/FixJ family response regulator
MKLLESDELLSKLLAQGLHTKEIGQRLSRSARTVDHHLAAIFVKLSVATRAEAVSAAYRLGVISSTEGNTSS